MYQEMNEEMPKKIYPTIDDISGNKHKKESIPRALREQVWITHIGKKYDSQCTVKWCTNIISAFDFHVGHNIPESAGGATDITNLRPICSRCNLSMGSRYSIDEWNKLSPDKKTVAKGCCIIC